MADTRHVVAFSSNSEYLAYADPSGSLKVWETATGTLKQKYGLGSNLSAFCTCISWSPKSSRCRETPSKKKRRITLTQPSAENPDLIALGTADGSVLLYSLQQDEPCAQLKKTHDDMVTGVCWDSCGENLYSCSKDQHIVQWTVSESQYKHKWKNEHGELCSICVCHTQSHLLTAGRIIQLWDLKTRQVLQTFHGHNSDVFRLLEVPNWRNPSSEIGDSIEGSYIISAAVNDTKISVRQIGTSVKNRDIVASFSLTEEPIQISISRPSGEQQPLKMIVLTRLGHLFVFEHVLNGKKTKPLSAKHVVKLVTKVPTNNEVARTLSVVAATFAPDVHQSILITYEDFLRPIFEKLLPSDLKPKLVREDPKKISKMSAQESVSKVKIPAVSNDVKMLGPGHMVSMTPVEQEGASTNGAKRRRKSIEVSIGDKVAAMDIDLVSAVLSNQDKDLASAKTNNSAVLLMQGLQSQDKTILNSVLQKSDPSFIQMTISRLPPECIIPLLKELRQRVSGHAQSGQIARRWVDTVVKDKTPYLKTVDVEDLLSSFVPLMETPPELISKFHQLKGKFDAIMSQMKIFHKDASKNSQPALCSVQNDDSDDDLFVEDVRHDTISEDEWEEDIEDVETTFVNERNKDNKRSGEDESSMEDDDEDED